ncbi:sulfatase-like hydrolase/transferase [Polaribacter sp. Z014]|uniref:sulfatase family protein n=1 Tax=Polaribacter sp. Z014 TaxID=2927126 RepID=UPI0020223063|nr:sulfatase-like hydrolase/transferase [Polaribacter sp. Z014]MCL7762538.1 sulfatase-like hydrolase/transferase [Polaribacter sp. Z014]
MKHIYRILFLTFFTSVNILVAQEKPNILVILADDLGYGDLGFTGSKEIKTPNLDKLANKGVVFKNGYVTHPFCGPSRAGLITGRYQARFGLEINLTNSKFDMHSGLPLSEKTFASRLKKSGYKTGIIGKWHLGGAEPFQPNSRGFDYFYGFLSGGHRYWPHELKTFQPLVSKKTGKPSYTANEGTAEPLTRNNQPATYSEYLTTALSKDAAKFVAESEKPFCLYLAYNAPHSPIEAPKKTIDKYKNIKDLKRRTYAAMIDELDQGIGRVIASLKASGKFENTMIFFLSDNGGVPAKKGYTYASNEPFLGGKGSMYEGGHHVPFILHWPNGKLKTGEFEGLVSSLDIAATAVAVGNGDTSGKGFDGKNLLPFLQGKKKGSPHEALFWRTNGNKSWAVRTEKSKYLFESRNEEEGQLFNMLKDPYERNNIIAISPELRKKLAKKWNTWNKDNIENIYLPASSYQKERLKMYKKLNDRLRKEAASKKPLIIK